MRFVSKLSLAAMSLACLCASPALAGENSLRSSANDYADAVSIAPSDMDLLGRWRTKVCPEITGLPEDQARFIADRIAQRALEAGLKVHGEACKANISVYFVEDGNRFANGINRNDPQTLQYYPEPFVTTLGRSALNDFMNDYRPIRWWHIGIVTDRKGKALSGFGAHNGPAPRRSTQKLSDAGFEGTFSGVATNRNAEATRLDKSTRNSFSHVFVIADTLRLDDKPLSEVADYIALASLAQINPQAEVTETPSILNLFDTSAPDEVRTSGFSALDKAYLESLYSLDSRIYSSGQHVRKIAQRMEAQLPD